MSRAAEAEPEGLVVAWYGDDFTGSAAVMEVLTFAGLPSVLFLEPPSATDLARFPNMRGIGIASMARAQTPDWMAAHLPAPFEWMRTSAAAICHYKTCSTFDSAPHIGSIGKAADVGQAIFKAPLMPMMIAAPAMRRFQAFGHLFASAGKGVFRLDRHPVMARHPVTPMGEADVTRHLALQTQLPIALLDLETLANREASEKCIATAMREEGCILAIDTMNHDDLARAGEVLWRNREHGRFVLGSQGVEYALIAYFQKRGWLAEAPKGTKLGPVEKLPIVSGSVSPITAQQIAAAEAKGFRVLPLDASALLGGEACALVEIDRVTQAALAVLDGGASPLICSARGPDDPAVAAFRASTERHRLTESAANGAVGAALGTILHRILDISELTRAVVSGGDTSGDVTRKLGVRALTAFAATTPGAALFKAHRQTPNSTIELALKGGQMGAEDLFIVLRDGL